MTTTIPFLFQITSSSVNNRIRAVSHSKVSISPISCIWRKQIIFAIFASWDMALQLESMIIPYTIMYRVLTYTIEVSRNWSEIKTFELLWMVLKLICLLLHFLPRLELRSKCWSPISILFACCGIQIQNSLSYFDPIIVILEYLHLIWAPVF